MAKLTENLSFTPYIDTYMGAPVEEFQQAVAQRQQLYDQNLAQASAIEDALGSIRAYEGDKDFLEEKISPYMDRLNQLADSGDYEKALNDVVRLGRKFTKDEDLRAIQDNYNAIQEYRKRLSELGGDALDFNPLEQVDPVTGERTLFSTRQRNELGDYVNRTFQSQLEQRKDYTARMQNLMRGIQADGSVTIGGENINIEDLGVSAKELPMILTRQWQGINKDKVRSVAETMLNAYLDTPEGQQDYRRLTQLEGLDPSTAEQDMINRLFEVATPQIGGQSRISATNLPSSFFETPAQPGARNFEALPAMENTIRSQFNADNYRKYNRERMMKPSIEGFPVSYNNPMVTSGDPDGKPSYGKFSPAEQRLNDNVAQQIYKKPMSELSSDEKDNVIQEASKIVENMPTLISSDYVPLSPDEMSDADKQIERNIASRRIYDPELGQPMDGGSYLKELIEEEGFEDPEIMVVGRNLPGNTYRILTGDDQFVTSQVVRIVDKGDPSKQRIVSVTGMKSEYEDEYGNENLVHRDNVRRADIRKAADFGEPVDISHMLPKDVDHQIIVNYHDGKYFVTIDGTPYPKLFSSPDEVINERYQIQ